MSVAIDGATGVDKEQYDEFGSETDEHEAYHYSDWSQMDCLICSG